MVLKLEQLQYSFIHYYFFHSIQQDDCRFSKYFNKTLVDTQANGFDADSEGSDCEIVPKENNTIDEMENGMYIWCNILL